jgi:hypothetical protein
MVERLRDECRGKGVDLSPAAAEEVLIDLVRNMANTLGVREETILRSYLANVDVAELATSLKHADEEQKREVADASPAVLSIENTGRLVASLAQAVRCVSLNHGSLEHGEREKWETIGVLDDASNGLTLIGEALENSHAAPQGIAVLWNDESVVYARRALTRTVKNLRNGAWSFGHGAALDADVAKRMTEDLEILPQEGSLPTT